MFKQWSIKNLLIFCSSLTIAFAISMVLMASYGQSYTVTMEHLFEKQIAPLNKASTELYSVVNWTSQRVRTVFGSQDVATIETLNQDAIVESFDTACQLVAERVPEEDASLNYLLDDIESFFDHYQTYEVSLITQKKAQLNIASDYEVINQKFEDLFEHLLDQAQAWRLSTDANVELAGIHISKALLSLMVGVHKELNLHNHDHMDDDKSSLRIQYEYVIDKAMRLIAQADQSTLPVDEVSEVFFSLSQLVFSDNGLFALHDRRHQIDHQLRESYLGSLEAIHELNILSNELVTEINRATYEKTSRLFNDANKLKSILSLLSISMVFAVLLIVWVIYRTMQAPIQNIRHAYEALAQGKFDTRLVESDSKNELLALSSSFNQFASRTEQLFLQIKKTQHLAEERGQYFRDLLMRLPEAVLSLDEQGVILGMNVAAESVLGAKIEDVGGRYLREFLTKEHHDISIEALDKKMRTSDEVEGHKLDGTHMDLKLALGKVDNEDNTYWVCIIADITEWKESDRRSKQLSKELGVIFDNAIIGIAYIRNRTLVRVNSRLEQLFGYETGELNDLNTKCLFSNGPAYEQFGEQAYMALADGASYEAQVDMRKKDGSHFWCELSGKAIDKDNATEGSIWLFEDVTTQRENEEYLTRLASLDPLTGLLNRSVFNDRIAHAIHKSARHAGQLAVCFIDLDHFKHINDSLGHKAGDTLLQEVAKRIKQSLREGDSVARLGGDEFALLLEDVSSVKDVAKIADKVVMAMAQPYDLEGKEVSVSPSIGISLYPSDGREGDLLIRNADAAMYHAKKLGRNNFQFYSVEMTQEATERVELESALRRATKLRQFTLHFQPQYDVQNQQICGAEVLIRWESEERGMVSPAKFIPVLEDTGLIGEVGEWVLEQACTFYVANKAILPESFKLAVNLSSRQFKGGNLISSISQVLAETQMLADNLELEITESLLMDDTALATLMLNEISQMGIQLAIDDFGTGYSSLSYLKQFPLNVLKIDRSFVRDLMVDEDDAAIVDAIFAMSTKLGLDVVAEGVETQEQFNYLAEIGCHRAQGFYLSRPLPEDEFLALLTEVGEED